MEIHIGKEIEKKYQESGLKLAEFAKRLNTGTRNIYSIFNRPDINSAQLKKIGEILGFDFFSLYQTSRSFVHEPTELYHTKKQSSISVIVELDGLQTTLEESIHRLQKINSIL